MSFLETLDEDIEAGGAEQGRDSDGATTHSLLSAKARAHQGPHSSQFYAQLDVNDIHKLIVPPAS
jgi:hypothetical protein